MTETASRDVVFVLYPGVQALDVTGPADVLAQAEAHRPGCYRLHFVGSHTRIVTSAGLELVARTGPQPARLERATVVVPGAPAPAVVDLLGDADAMDRIVDLAAKVERVASVCSGAFALARLGLLAGRRVTTHWAGWQLLAEMEPSVTIERDRLVVVDGHVWTSGGVASGIDLALAMVEADLGAEVALAVSRDLVMPLRRSGQAAYVDGVTPTTDTSHTSPVLRAIQQAGRRRPTVLELADAVGMSERTLHRHCRTQFGTTPGRLIAEVALDRARVALIGSDHSISQVARACGFSDESALSRAFHRTYGMAPGQFRRSFRAHDPGTDATGEPRG